MIPPLNLRIDVECLDIITEDGVGISVWANEIPSDEPYDGPMGDNWIDLIYPGLIPTAAAGIQFAKHKLGEFIVRSCG